jgi:hypothetical protein
MAHQLIYSDYTSFIDRLDNESILQVYLGLRYNGRLVIHVCQTSHKDDDTKLFKEREKRNGYGNHLISPKQINAILIQLILLYSLSFQPIIVCSPPLV